MSNPGLFKDLGKRVTDFLTKDYPLGEKKVEWKGETSQGVTVETNFNIKGEAVTGTITPKYKWGKYGLNFLGEFNTKRELKAEVSADDVAPGLKLTVTGQSRGETTGTVAAEYKHEYATVTAAVELGRAAGTTVRSSLVVSPGVKGLAVGASAEYLVGAVEESDLKEINSTVAYATKEFDVALFGRVKHGEDKNEVGGQFYHQVNADSAVGGEIVFDAAHTEKKPKLTVGVQHKYSAETSLKAKFDTTGQLGFSYQQLFPNKTKLTVASSVDVNNLTEKSTKFGVALALNF